MNDLSNKPKENTVHFASNRTRKRSLSRSEIEAESLIAKVFSEVNFGRYSIPEEKFAGALKNHEIEAGYVEMQTILERLAELSSFGLVQKSNGFYGLTKEGREYFESKNIH